MVGHSVWSSGSMRNAREAGDLGAIVRLIRLARGLTQEELGSQCGYSASTISRLETGGQPLSNIELLRVLSRVLEIPPYLLGLAADSDRRRTERLSSPFPYAKVAARQVPAQLPADVHGFVGRHLELDQLDGWLGSPDRQPTTVVISAVSGTAGVGKTALAVHWAHQIADRFPDGQLYVNLRGFDPTGTTMDPADAVRGFLDALGIEPQQMPIDLDTQIARYRTLLAGKRVLVVLDNARDSEQVRPLLPGSPGCLVVVTSRSSLGDLVGREGAHPLVLDLPTDAEARALLEQRLGSDRVRAEPEAARQIVTSCARLPLALAMVAARAAMRPRFPLRLLTDQLSDAETRLDALIGESSQASLRTVFSWSYTQLTRRAQRAFRLLGLHPGPDTSVAAVASLVGVPPGESSQLLDELTGARLVSEPKPGRYALHDLLRVYAAELTRDTDAEDERQRAVHRLLDHYLHTAYAADQLLDQHRDDIGLASPRDGVTPERPADQERALGWFEAEHPALLAAIGQAAAAGFDAYAWRLAWTLDTFLDRRGHWHDQAAAWQVGLDAAQRSGDRSAQARAHRGLARRWIRMGRISEAREQARQALDLHTQLGDRNGQAHSHHALGRVHGQEEDYARALDHATQALDLYREAGRQRGQARALNDIGWCHAKLGDYAQALNFCERALDLFRELGDRDGEAITWDSLGYAHHHLGRYDNSVGCYRHALVLIRDVGDRNLETKTLVHIGDSQQAAGLIDSARETWQQALEILDELDHPGAEDVRAKLASLDRLSTGPADSFDG